MRTFWGIQLEEALTRAHTQPRAGDEVGIRLLGSQPVVVVSRSFDRDGRERGQKEISTHRNQWLIEKREYFANPDLAESALTAQATEKGTSGGMPPPAAAEAEAAKQARMRKAQALRNGQLAKEELIRDDPTLGAILFKYIRTAEILERQFAKNNLSRNDDRDSFVKGVRNWLADKIERGEPVKDISPEKMAKVITRSLARAVEVAERTVIEKAADRVQKRQPPERDQPQMRA
jgi:hypothetical protein